MSVSRYLEIFIDESNEHLQNLKDCILVLEREPDNQRKIEEACHAAHSLKGMAATMGFRRIGNLAQGMEDVFTKLSRGAIYISSRMLDLLLECLDAAEQHLLQIAKTAEEGIADNEALLLELSELGAQSFAKDEKSQRYALSAMPLPKLGGGERKPDFSGIPFTKEEKRAILSAARTGSHIYGFIVAIEPDCLFWQARAVLVWKAVEQFGWVLFSRPRIFELKEGKTDSHFRIFLASMDRLSEIRLAVERILEVRLEAAGELKPEDIAQKKEKKAASEAGSKKPSAAADAKEKKPETRRTVCVEEERLDDLTERLTALILAKNSLLSAYAARRGDDGAWDFDGRMEELAHVTAGLQETVLQMRMVSMERVTNKFPRMLRDFARKKQKEIELYISGEDTQVDRMVAERMELPLWELLRNAAEHGIESPEIRKERKKQEKGAIYLNLYQEAGRMVIYLSDDGNGMDVEKAWNPSEHRGGLDRARRAVEELGGEIEVESVFEKGTNYAIRVPITQITSQVLVARVRHEKYAVALPFVWSVEDILQKDILEAGGREVVSLAGEEIPLVRLDQILGLEPLREEKKALTAIFVRKGKRCAGLLVDSVLGQQEAVVKPLGGFIRSSKAIRGAAIFGEGEIALVIDINVVM